ncbi:hypothetical protein Desaci_1294 [Desulfosporosinus acidiphilus SJ4]|uniref:Virulence-related protein n=1 Tax=Desulfosporosinus acidiphilus (strain DSM 22704 / JCM 16185 / SJ4) TaxID=646529 RepID=I4D3E6_DESAJ|nr:hypothetical protein [Desulfosporosinus acidiphilus]AFM40320.1 hypothetical protein Desaci_1294 [Desulfosporosinus acidiphilus SJ4]
MTNETFTLTFKVTGLERKQIACIIGEAVGQDISYAGAPSFFYRAGDWTIDRDSVITSPETPLHDKDNLRKILAALKAVGVIAEGDGTVTLPLDGHSGNTLRNAINLIWCKQSLLKKSFDRQTDMVPESLVGVINAVPIDTMEEFAEVVNNGIDQGTIIGDSNLDFDLAEQTVSFSFMNATLEFDEVLAFITFCHKLSVQSKLQKFSSTKQKEAVNEKYAMRCFLLKLGFITEEFKTERKILLQKLDGNAAFRTIEAQQAAESKRKTKQEAS